MVFIDPRLPSYRQPILRQRANTYVASGFGRDPEAYVPPGGPPPPAVQPSPEPETPPPPPPPPPPAPAPATSERRDENSQGGSGQWGQRGIDESLHLTPFEQQQMNRAVGPKPRKSFEEMSFAELLEYDRQRRNLDPYLSNPAVRATVPGAALFDKGMDLVDPDFRRALAAAAPPAPRKPPEPGRMGQGTAPSDSGTGIGYAGSGENFGRTRTAGPTMQPPNPGRRPDAPVQGAGAAQGPGTTMHAPSAGARMQAPAGSLSGGGSDRNGTSGTGVGYDPRTGEDMGRARTGGPAPTPGRKPSVGAGGGGGGLGGGGGGGQREISREAERNLIDSGWTSETSGAGRGGGAANRGGGGGGSSGSSRVICTHFFRKGELDRDLWQADLRWTYEHCSPATIRGYQFWAIPVVRMMRAGGVRGRALEAAFRWVARHRAEEIAHKVGIRARGSIRGKLARLAFEPASWLIGQFVGEQDWQRLYEENDHAL
jgi:hypothetical protein